MFTVDSGDDPADDVGFTLPEAMEWRDLDNIATMNSSPTRRSTEKPVAGGLISLGELIDMLGSNVLQLVVAPAGSDVPLTGPLVEGLDDERLGLRDKGQVLLATSPIGTETELLTALHAASGHGCSAVVVKAPDLEPAVMERVGSELEIAVLTTPADTSWRHLDRLVSAACQTATAGARAFTAALTSDLFTLANEVAYAVGGAVTIEDNSDRVLAYSNLPHQEIDESRRQTILGREVPADARRTNAVPRMAADGHVVHVAPVKAGELGRMAIVVRFGLEILGTIWVIERSQLGAASERALLRGASAAALHLIRARATSDPDRRGRVESLMTLLDGSDGRTAAAARLGLDARTAYAVLAMGPESGDAEADLSTARLLEVAGIYCGAWHPSSVCAISGTTVYALVPIRETAGAKDHLARVAHDVVRTVLRTSSFSVRVGIGSVATGREQIHTSRRVADTVLRAIAAERDVAVATADDVRSRVVLAELRATAVPAFELGVSPVQAIIDHDLRRGSEYAKTLLVWLDSFGDVRRAAATLFVHENTLRYRIRRATERFGIDLEDPNVRLVTWLELRLRF